MYLYIRLLTLRKKERKRFTGQLVIWIRVYTRKSLKKKKKKVLLSVISDRIVWMDEWMNGCSFLSLSIRGSCIYIVVKLGVLRQTDRVSKTTLPHPTLLRVHETGTQLVTRESTLLE